MERYITPKIIFSTIENIGKSNLAGLDTTGNFNKVENLFMNLCMRIGDIEKMASMGATMDVNRQDYIDNYSKKLSSTSTYTR